MSPSLATILVRAALAAGVGLLLYTAIHHVLDRVQQTLAGIVP